MTIPYLMNCSHSHDGWCLECVAQMGREHEAMRVFLKRARTNAREHHGVTTRKFASIIGATPTQLCELTDDAPTTAPDFVD